MIFDGEEAQKWILNVTDNWSITKVLSQDLGIGMERRRHGAWSVFFFSKRKRGFLGLNVEFEETEARRDGRMLLLSSLSLFSGCLSQLELELGSIGSQYLVSLHCRCWDATSPLLELPGPGLHIHNCWRGYLPFMRGLPRLMHVFSDDGPVRCEHTTWIYDLLKDDKQVLPSQLSIIE